ncbi:MAG: TonB-dependent receptor [Rhizomicrobium sp.]
MRGLNGDQVLYLVNGKRRHTTALINNLARVGNGGVPVDLDLIPVAAVDHVEVLRDGAAAQYGSDAIAGVINIILKDGAEGGESNSTVGLNYAGDGFSAHEAADYGIALPHDGFAHFAIDARTSAPWYRNEAATTTYLYNLLPDGLPDPREATIDRSAFGHPYGGASDKIFSLSYNADQPLNDGVTLYSFSTVSHRFTEKNTGSFLPSNINSLPEIYPNGFQAYRIINEYDFQSALGAKGALDSWNWDLSTNFAQDYANLDGRHTLNATLGPSSPTAFHLSRHDFQQWTNTLDVTRPFDIGLAAPLAVSFGAEHRYEWFQIGAGDPLAYKIGDYVIPAGQPHAGLSPIPGLASYAAATPGDAGQIDRNNFAGYFDLDTNILPNWYVGLAGRFEHYTDSSGDSKSGKFTTRYEFLPGYAIRGTISNGFRAPSLAQEIFSTPTFSGQYNKLTGVNDIYELQVLPVTRPAAQALGATPLTPEQSQNYSVGLTAQPIENLNFSVDAYQINVHNRILLSGNIGGLPGSPQQNFVNSIIEQYGLTPDTIIQYYTNAVSTRTRGVDVVGDYAIDLGDYGGLTLSAAYSWNQTEITHLNPTPLVLQGQNIALVGYQREGDLTVATPKGKLLFTGDWHENDLGVHLQVTRYGSYTERGTVDPNVNPLLASDRTYSPKWIANLAFTYDINSKLSLTVGADNLFNTYPDKIGPVDANTGIGQYGLFSPFGISGGFYYTRLGVKLGDL